MKKFFLLLAMIIVLSNVVFSKWEKISDSLKSPFPGKSDVTLGAEDYVLFAGVYNNGIFYTYNSGKSWVQADSGKTYSFVHSFSFYFPNIYAATDDGILLCTGNYNTWVHSDSGITLKNVMTIVSDGKNLFAGTLGGGIFLSTDNGNFWIQKNSGLTGKFVQSLAIKGNSIIAGTDGGVFISTNNGDNWTLRNNGLTNEYIFSLTVIGNNIFAGTSGVVFLSTDDGNNWIPRGLNYRTVFTIATNGDYLLAGTDEGIYLSNDSGNTWFQENDGLTDLFIHSIVIQEDVSIYAGDDSTGIFTTNYSKLSGITENLIPDNTQLNISPNPSTDNITISFTKKEISTPVICIYNSLGIEIKRLGVSDLTNRNSINFSSKDFSSGVYYCSLTSAMNIVTKSFIVLK